MSAAAQLSLDLEQLPTWARVACPDCGAWVGEPCVLEPGDAQGAGRTSPWRSAHDHRHGAAFALSMREREADDLVKYGDELEEREPDHWDRWLAGESGPLEAWAARIAAYVPPKKPRKRRLKAAGERSEAAC